MTTLTLTYAFAADHNAAVLSEALSAMAATADELANRLSEQTMDLPMAEQPGDEADELFRHADNAVQSVFALSDLFTRAARRIA